MDKFTKKLYFISKYNLVIIGESPVASESTVDITPDKLRPVDEDQALDTVADVISVVDAPVARPTRVEGIVKTRARQVLLVATMALSAVGLTGCPETPTKPGTCPVPAVAPEEPTTSTTEQVPSTSESVPEEPSTSTTEGGPTDTTILEEEEPEEEPEEPVEEPQGPTTTEAQSQEPSSTTEPVTSTTDTTAPEDTPEVFEDFIPADADELGVPEIYEDVFPVDGSPEVMESPVSGIIYEGNPNGERIAFVGDSLTVLASTPNVVSPLGAIQGAFKEAYRVHVNAQNGQTIEEMMDEIDGIIEDPNGAPAALFINLGTNNINRRDQNVKQKVDALIERLATSGVPCVIMVTVNTRTDLVKNNDSDFISSTINSAIDKAEVDHPNILAVKWNPDWLPEWGNGELDHLPWFTEWVEYANLPPMLQTPIALVQGGSRIGDTVHPSNYGSAEWIARVKNRLIACLIGKTCELQEVSEPEAA